ncbi:hypothetical protein BpHYR1_051457, partial [Brachionus plicatilis]
TGGQYVSLEDAANLSNVIVGGTREEISMEKMMAEVHNDLMREAAEKGTRIDEEQLTKRVHEILNSKKPLQNINKLNTDIEITDTTKQLSQVTSLEQMKQFATDHNLKLINDPYFFSKSTFSMKSTSLSSSALSLGKKKVVKKPLIKKTTSRKPKLKSVPKNKSRSRVAGCRLRRSKRIKEIEERKKKTMLIKDDNSPNFESKKTTTFKRKKSEQSNNSQSESDKDQSEKENIVEINNKKSKKESSPPEIVATESTIADENNDVADVPSEKEEFIDIDRARRLAKKVIAPLIKSNTSPGFNFEDVFHEPLILVGGFKSSGTSLVRSLLDVHPECKCGPEIKVSVDSLPFLNVTLKQKIFSKKTLLDSEKLRKALSLFAFYNYLNNVYPTYRICNKEPANFQHIKLFKQLFPNSKFILVVRDGRESSYSWVKRTHAKKSFKVFFKLLKLWNSKNKNAYNQCIETGRDFCKIIYYSKLVANPEEETRKMAEFLNLEWTERFLNHQKYLGNEIKLAKHEYSLYGLKKQINSDSLNNWVGKISDYDEELVTKEIDMLRTYKFIS